MFGNERLNKLFKLKLKQVARPQNKIRNLLTEYPDGARFQNQFGRIPLHYAVDRSKVNMDALKLLLDAYPAGANLKATDGATPYDLGMCSYFW